jgi:hypothetical protein
MYNILPIFFLLIVISTLLLIFAPMIDHLFYIDHKLEETSDLEIFFIALVHILLTGFFIYTFHTYIIKKYFEIFNISNSYKTYKVIIDLILALILVSLQRNLHFKLRYLSNKHPIRSTLIL